MTIGEWTERKRTLSSDGSYISYSDIETQGMTLGQETPTVMMMMTTTSWKVRMVCFPFHGIVVMANIDDY